MLYRYRPSAPLDAFVEWLWWSHREQPSAVCEHALPSGSADLVIALHDEQISWAGPAGGSSWSRCTRGVVHGPQTTYFLTGPKPKGTVIGVSFRPGAAGAVLGVPAEALVDRHVSIEELWGCRGRELHERLSSAVDPRAALTLLERELLARIHRPLLIHPAVAYALRAALPDAGLARVKDVQRETGYSPRRFIELFRSAVGLTPKHYYRIRRFSRVLSRLAAREAPLADLAASSGYADQSHLTREFRELAGVTPAAYRPRSLQSTHHHVSDQHVAGTASHAPDGTGRAFGAT